MPYWRDNELKALALMENDFEYEGTFNYEPGVRKVKVISGSTEDKRRL